MKLDQLWPFSGIFKMECGSFKDIFAQLFPSFSLRENRMAQGPGVKPTFFGFAYLED